MRKVVVAALALSPVLLHAQANSPAQPRTSTASTLRAELILPTFGAPDSDGSTRASTHVRVSTGVIAPKLVHTVDVQSDSELVPAYRFDRTVVVSLIVDPTGRPSDLKIVQSLNPVMDKNVLAAVSEYRFTPGALDDQPTSVPVTLAVVLRNPEW